MNLILWDFQMNQSVIQLQLLQSHLETILASLRNTIK